MSTVLTEQLVEAVPHLGHVEYRIAGPPGTGKTTTTAQWVRRAVERYGDKAVLCASYTKAAAVELGGRDLHIESSQIGTLHAHGYRALGKPPVVDDKMLVEWNEREPDYTIKPGAVDVDDPIADTDGGGDDLLSRYDLLRARMTPRDMWPGLVLEFAEKWERWKAEHEAVDFGDMIERPRLEVPVAPGNPSVGFFDEVQDCSRAEWALIRHWARTLEYVVCVGDDDQSIYQWRGADPQCFVDPPLPDEFIRVLDQSYRVPRAVHERAVEWIEEVDARLPKLYKPRPEDGAVESSRASYNQPELLLDEVLPYAEAGKRVAILGSCSFHLNAIVRHMREEGVPFHNPWRRRRGDWNPLHAARGTSTKQRLLAWLGPSLRADGTAWTFEEVGLWLPLVKADGVLRRGAKAEIGRAESMSYEQFASWFEPEAIMASWDGDVEWLLRHAAPPKLGSLEYLAKIRDRGLLESDPKIIVSTIHACKGGEADVVFVMPDLSRAGYRTWIEDEAQIRRLFYVAMTRTRETLVLCEPGSRMAVRL